MKHEDPSTVPHLPPDGAPIVEIRNLTTAFDKAREQYQAGTREPEPEA